MFHVHARPTRRTHVRSHGPPCFGEHPMIDSRKIVRDTEITLLITALIIIIAMAGQYYMRDTYDYNDLGNCMKEWDQAIKDDWNPDFYEDACNAIKEQVQ